MILRSFVGHFLDAHAGHEDVVLVRRLGGLLVRWCVGALVRWCVGLLVCWFVGLLVCWFVGLLVLVGLFGYAIQVPNSARACMRVGLVVWLFGCLVVWLFGCLVVWLYWNSVTHYESVAEQAGVLAAWACWAGWLAGWAGWLAAMSLALRFRR
jgi:hypothetical protein